MSTDAIATMETQPLLPKDPPRDVSRIAPNRVLPVPLIAALAMASSAATAYFAYATLLCKDATKCQNEEFRSYAGSVAAATAVANLLGVATTGTLQALLTRHQQFGLLLWLGVRSMSTVMLLLGVSIRNIFAALSGRIFEGLASDNLLHFLLNSIYVRGSDDTSSLFARSLALYMVGISIGPFLVGLLRNFTTSLSIALGLFAVAAVYILLFARASKSSRIAPDKLGPSERETQQDEAAEEQPTVTFWAPLKPFVDRPALGLFALTLFCFNMSQSYIFDALLIHSTVRFGFTNRQHGFLITIAHSIASSYIFVASFLLNKTSISRSTRDASQSLFSLAVQVVALVGFGFADRASQIYGLTVLIAFGLPALSFIKSYFVSKLDEGERVPGLAALAVVEGVGSVLGPVVIGRWQTVSSGDGTVFFGAAGLVGLAAVSFCLGAICVHRDTSEQSPET
ncbi:MFS general substrate transporter [Polyplosphaeria fusca]|uniref:MFS general substrate transporter n=1 Tax=Polyplosphaeria fusca TaxID=682080 RepID=A0A9P4QQE1_9PLEO|nr:MFS general substrate transporter [Polyplosphaeria fusca]